MLAIKWRPQHLNGTFVKGKQRGCSIFQKKKNKKNPQLHNWTPHDAPPPPTTTNVQWPSDCLAISSILLKLLAFSGLLSTRRLYVVLTAIQFCLDSIRFDTIRFDFFFWSGFSPALSGRNDIQHLYILSNNCFGIKSRRNVQLMARLWTTFVCCRRCHPSHSKRNELKLMPKWQSMQHEQHEQHERHERLALALATAVVRLLSRRPTRKSCSSWKAKFFWWKWLVEHRRRRLTF